MLLTWPTGNIDERIVFPSKYHSQRLPRLKAAQRETKIDGIPSLQAGDFGEKHLCSKGGEAKIFADERCTIADDAIVRYMRQLECLRVSSQITKFKAKLPYSILDKIIQGRSNLSVVRSFTSLYVAGLPHSTPQMQTVTVLK